MYVYVHMCWFQQDQERASDPLELGVTGHCELLNTRLGNQTQVLGEGSKALNR